MRRSRWAELGYSGYPLPPSHHILTTQLTIWLARNLGSCDLIWKESRKLVNYGIHSDFVQTAIWWLPSKLMVATLLDFCVALNRFASDSLASQ